MPTTLPTISASDNSVIDEVLVLGFALDKKSKKFSILSGELRVDQGPLLQALTDLGASGASDEVIKLPGSASKLILLTALTLKADGSIAHEVLRRAAGAAARSLAGTASATFALPQASKQDFQAIAEGALLGSYTFDEFRGSSKADRKPALKKITIYSKKAKDKSYLQAIKRAEIIAKYTHLTRDLINTPQAI